MTDWLISKQFFQACLTPISWQFSYGWLIIKVRINTVPVNYLLVLLFQIEGRIICEDTGSMDFSCWLWTYCGYIFLLSFYILFWTLNLRCPYWHNNFSILPYLFHVYRYKILTITRSVEGDCYKLITNCIIA